MKYEKNLFVVVPLGKKLKLNSYYPVIGIFKAESYALEQMPKCARLDLTAKASHDPDMSGDFRWVKLYSKGKLVDECNSTFFEYHFRKVK